MLIRNIPFHWQYCLYANPMRMVIGYRHRAIHIIYLFRNSSLFNDYCYRRRVCSNNNASKAGVTLSAFHGMKGLEFKHVYVIYMDKDVFPNFHLIESRGYPACITKELQESETGLWYVTVTRAIDDLTVYYSAVNPRRYVQPHLAGKAGI